MSRSTRRLPASSILIPPSPRPATKHTWKTRSAMSWYACVAPFPPRTSRTSATSATPSDCPCPSCPWDPPCPMAAPLGASTGKAAEQPWVGVWIDECLSVEAMCDKPHLVRKARG